MTKNIKLRKVNKEFQGKLSNDIRKIKSLEKVIANAEKSRNAYEISKEEKNMKSVYWNYYQRS